MRRSLRWMLLPLFVWLSGCHHAHHARIGFHYGFVSVERDAVVIRVKGYDQARVTPQGQLLVGGKALAVSPEGQAALARYNAAGHQFVDRSLKLGLDSANFALHTVGKAFKGLLHGDPDRVGQSAEQGSHDIEARARTLCPGPAGLAQGPG